MTPTWWIVSIAGIASAWYLGYRMRGDKVAHRHSQLPRDYLVGLNFLLNEEPDKAVDVFIKMMEVDSETVETHLAVGKLFRRRGEVDRAIRIHQNLIARPQLDTVYREQSLFELGHDYLSAGMLDRAERIFLDVLNIKRYAVSALQSLLLIYQQEKEWENAIHIAKKLASATHKNREIIVAHYFCELAEIANAKQDFKKAEIFLEEALDEDPRCVRASLLQAHYAMNKKDFKLALKSLKRIKSQDSDYLSESIDALASCYEALDDEEGLIQYLMGMLQEYPRVPVVLILSERIRKWKGDKTAAKFVADYVRRYPSLSGLNLFIKLYISNTQGREREDLEILQGLMTKLLSDKPDYQCTSCGFSGKSLHWQCPGCKQWSTIKPLHSLENVSSRKFSSP